MENIKLSNHFQLSEFCNWQKYPQNTPTIQQIANMGYGCRQLLEAAREAIGCPIIVNSGFRNEAVNRKVGGIRNSQLMTGYCHINTYNVGMTDISSSGRSYLEDDGLQAGGADSLMSSQRLHPTNLSKVDC